jgi:hypothetical protein
MYAKAKCSCVLALSGYESELGMFGIHAEIARKVDLIWMGDACLKSWQLMLPKMSFTWYADKLRIYVSISNVIILPLYS